MHVLHSIAELAGVPGPVFIAVGVFDGVHLGHKALIERTMKEAAAASGTCVVLSFDPHPARVLRPKEAPRLLTSTSHKIRLIEALGCEYMLLVTFDPVFASQSPEDFVREVCARSRPLGMICVGHKWTFGKNRSGNVDLLKRMGTDMNFETLEIPPVQIAGQIVSSTLIRKAVLEGNFEEAKQYLGRDYTILGTVVPGLALGRKLGFPTANLSAHNEQFPPDGVYAVHVLLSGRRLHGVANIGWRPTITTGSQRLLEIHVFDFSEDIYGRDIEIAFVRFLREEKKFENTDALRDQIEKDSAEARRLLG